jgi:photosystem II stability/assembly factor-like uncharacterized protein
MKQLLFYVIVILFTILSYSSNTFAQGNWEQMLPPGPTSNQMVSLYFADENIGWSVGEHGTILKTTNGGESWQLIHIPWLTYLKDVFFVNELVGYIVGQDGLILKSNDGGESWFLKQTQFTNNLNRVLFCNENKGWIIGEKGLILYTDDGGLNWQQQISNCRSDLLGIDFISSDSLCTVGSENTILISPIQGQNWDIIPFTPTQGEIVDFRDVYFIDAHEGWIGGGFETGILIHTTNSGQTWQEIKIQSHSIRDLDGNITSGPGMPHGFQQVYFYDQSQGLCLSGGLRLQNFEGNLPYYTNDGGKTWKCRISGGNDESNDLLGRFCFLNDSRLINIGYQGEFRFSNDSGKSWSYISPNRAISNYIIGNDGIVVSVRYVLDQATNLQQRIWSRSEDYGKTWQDFAPIMIDSAGNNIDIMFDDFISWFSAPFTFIDNHKTLWTLYRHQDSNSIFESKDYGLTWHWIRGGLKSFIFDDMDVFPHYSKFLSPDTFFQYEAWLSEPENNEYKTVLDIRVSFDGGYNIQFFQFPDIWNDITPFMPFANPPIVKDYFFINTRTGFLVGRDGNIIKTEDSGQTWNAINSGVIETLWDIGFIDSLLGIVVGDFGRILKTEDCGETWRKVNSGTQENIYSIDFLNDHEYWVGTETGMRFTVDKGETWNSVPLRYQQSLIKHIEFDNNRNGYAFTANLPQNYLHPTIYGWVDETGARRPNGYNLLLSWKNEGSKVKNPDEGNNLPFTFELKQNYPNPFNNSTRITYESTKQGRVILKIFNLQGQLVKKLVDELQKAGIHYVNWDGRSNSGKEVTSGVYIYSIESDQKIHTKKMLYLR